MTRIIKRWFGMIKNRLEGERGVSLTEVVVAVGIMAVVVLAFVSALSTGSIAVREGEQEVVSQRLAQTQLEYIKGCPYNSSYSAIDVPERYSISVEVGSTPDNDTDIQKISVTVYRDGEDILTVEDYKVNR
jgi:Tfp pilus assembly protein PilV